MKLLKPLAQFVRKHPGAFILVAITLIIARANYTPNTFLTGWDTLHPEFNYGIYWKRILGGVWQEHQGLGAVATQAHASEISRIPVLMLLDLFLKMSQVRYAYAFLMLILGPLGVYAFLKCLLRKKYQFLPSEAGALMSGLFYLLNLGTLQHFYVPLEMFLTHFGYLGWFFLAVIKFLERRDKKSLVWFALVSFLSSSQAHTATLFYALFLCLAVFLGVLALVDLVKKEIITLKLSGILLGVLLLVNSFWLLPNLYFAVTHGEDIQKSKIHQLFSEEAFLQNKAFGTVKDMAILKNFLFSWGEHVGNGEFGELLDEWNAHLRKPLVLPLGYISFGIVLLGILVSFVKRDRVTLALLGTLLVCWFFLFNVNPPFGFIFEFFQQKIPLFKEAFRFPFTKFSIVTMLIYSVFFGYFVFFLSSVLGRFLKGFLVIAALGLVTAGLVYYMWPAFTGHLVSPSMRVDIPDRYFELFDYLNSQNEFGRVAELPIHTFWGWIYYNWDPQTSLGYQGAGFLWFGIDKPLLAREFDRWGLSNEQYYREMSQAIYSENVLLLERVLEKYKVKWLIFDSSIIAPGANQKQLFYPQIKKLLDSSEKISLDRDFGNGLLVYKFAKDTPFTKLEVLTDVSAVGQPLFKEYTDDIYAVFGTYIEGSQPKFPLIGITDLDERLPSRTVSSDTMSLYVKAQNSQEVISGSSMFEFDVRVLRHDGTLSVSLKDSSGVFGGEEQVFEVPYLGEDYNILQIGDAAFFLNDLGSEWVTVGSVLLDPEQVAALLLYRSAGKALDETSFVSKLDVCSSVGAGAAYSIQRVTGGFTLSSKSAIGCVTVSLAEVLVGQGVASDGLLLLSMAGGLNKSGDVCIFDQTLGLCGNTAVKDGKSFMFLRDTSKVGDLYLRFLSNTSLQPSEVSVTYKDISLELLPPVYKQDLVLDFNMPQVPSELVFNKQPYDFVKNSRPYVCQTGEVTSATKIAPTEQASTVSYRAVEDSVCDAFSFPLASHTLGYILELHSRNIQGLPIRVCLTNEYSKRCDIYVSLPGYSEPGPAKSFYMIPPMGNGRGYTVNINNLVLGGTPSQNDLLYVNLIPIPYAFLRGAVDLAPVSKAARVFVYNEAFDAGWVAFCGLQSCSARHVRVNNWANGWVFDGDVPPDIHVIFWPQLWEIIGLGLLAGVFAVLTLGNKVCCPGLATGLPEPSQTRTP